MATSDELLRALGQTPANQQVGKPTSRDKLESAINAPAPSSDFSERLARIQAELESSNLSTIDWTPPEGGWNRVMARDDDSGAIGKLFKTLARPIAFTASTAMETADLVTGEGASLREWWDQFAGADPIHWGDVRRKHEDIYKYMIPFTFGLSALPAAFESLADVTGQDWLDSAADFSANLIFDPLNLAGGIGKLASLRGAKQVAANMSRVANARNTGYLVDGIQYTDDVIDAAKVASDAMVNGRSLSAGIRELRKLGPAGQKLLDDFGLDAGLRIRLPGGGTFGRMARFDRIPGVAHVVNKARASNVKLIDRAAAGLTMSADDTTRLAQRIREVRAAGGKIAVEEGDKLGQLAVAASKTPVEVLLPKGLRATALTLNVMDAPIRGWTKFMRSPGAAANVVRNSLIGSTFNPAQHMDPFLTHPDPAVSAAFHRIHTDTRGPTWISRMFQEDIANNTRDAVNRALLHKISMEDLHELASFQNLEDVLVDGVLHPNMPESLKALSDEELVILHQKATATANASMSTQLPHRSGSFADGVNDVLDTEGGYVPRNVTAEGRELLGFDDGIPLVDEWRQLAPEGRRSAANLMDRKIRVGQPVDVTVPQGYKVPEGVTRRVGLDRQQGRVRLRLVDEVQDPRVVGKSVARQLNEAAEELGLPQIYDANYGEAWIRYGNTVGTDFRMRLIENVFARYGVLVDLEDLGLHNSLETLFAQTDKASRLVTSINKARANASKLRQGAIDAGVARRKAYQSASRTKILGTTRPTNVGSDEILQDALKFEDAFDVTNSHLVEASIIANEIDVVVARLDELARTRPRNGSIRSKEYEDTVQRLMELTARAEQIRLQQEATDGVVDILKRMIDIEETGLPAGEPPEARVLASAFRGGRDKGQPVAMYDEVRDELADVLDFIESDVIPGIERIVARYANESPEIKQLQELVKAARGTLRGSKSTLNTNRAASKRIEEFDKTIKKFKEADEAVGGHEQRVQTANPSEPAQQLQEVAESLERQTRWVEQQYAALAADEDLVRAGQVLPEEALPGVREGARVVPREGDRIGLEGPDVVLTEEEALRRVKTVLGEQRSVALQNFAEANAQSQRLFNDLQERVARFDRAIAAGDRADAIYQRNIIRAGHAEDAANKMEFEQLQPIYEEFERLLRMATVRLSRAQSLRGQEGLGDAAGLDRIVEQLDELIERFRVHEAQPMSLSKENLDTAKQILAEDMQHWGPWTVLGNEQTTAVEVVKLLDGYGKAMDTVALKGFGKKYNRLHNLIKSHQLTSFGFVSRNVMGAMMAMWLEGVPPTMLFRTRSLMNKAAKIGEGDLVRGIDTILADPASKLAQNKEFGYMKTLIEMGVLRSGQGATSLDTKVAVSLNRTARILKNRNPRSARKGEYSRVEFAPWRSDNILSKNIQTLNNNWEDAIRLSTGMHFMSMGADAGTALNAIARSQFDYGELTRNERAVKMVIPFYTWTRKNIPYQFSQLWRQPGKYNSLYSAKRVLEDRSEEENWVPSYFMAPFGVRLPFAPGGNKMYFVPDLPFVDLFKFRSDDGNFGVDLGRQVLTETTPILKAPLELISGKQFFKGLPISDKYEKVPYNWANIPGLSQALTSFGLLKNGKMRRHNQYVIEQFVPFYSRFIRMAGDDKRHEGYRQLQNNLSFWLGLPLKFNTTDMQRSAIMQYQRELAAERRDFRDLRNPNR